MYRYLKCDRTTKLIPVALKTGVLKGARDRMTQNQTDSDKYLVYQKVPFLASTYSYIQISHSMQTYRYIISDTVQQESPRSKDNFYLFSWPICLRCTQPRIWKRIMWWLMEMGDIWVSVATGIRRRCFLARGDTSRTTRWRRRIRVILVLCFGRRCR